MRDSFPYTYLIPCQSRNIGYSSLKGWGNYERQLFCAISKAYIFTKSWPEFKRVCVCLCPCIFVCPTEYSLLSWSGIRMHGLFSHLSTWNRSLATGRSSRNRWTSPPYVRSLWAASESSSLHLVLFLLKAGGVQDFFFLMAPQCNLFSAILRFSFCFRYQNLETFIIDVNLVFDNCEKFNEDNSDIGRAGHNMRKFFEKRWTELLKQTN